MDENKALEMMFVDLEDIKCRKDRFCGPLHNRLVLSKEEKVGLFPVVLQRKTGAETVIVYKNNQDSSGLILNFCPWCGERIFTK